MVCHARSMWGEANTLKSGEIAAIKKGLYLGYSIKAAMKNFNARHWDNASPYPAKDLLVWLFQDGQPLWKIPYGPDEE